jgi:outer membrane protein TolC
MTGNHHSTALWRPVPAALLSVLFSACVHYQAAPLEPQRSAQAFAARQLDEPALRAQIMQVMPDAAAQWPPREWDRADLLAVALLQNPTLAIANAQARAALAHEITAGERPNPAMTLQSEYARHDSFAWLYGVAFNWLLHSPERRRLEISIAQVDTRNARLELMDQAWSVRHELIAALSGWEAAHRRAELLDR